MNTSPNVTLRPDFRIIAVLSFLCDKYQRRWCYPSQDTLLELLRRFHGLHIERRTLNRHLAGFESLGYIQRTRRHTKNKDGSLHLKSTVYTLTATALTFIQSIARAAKDLSTKIVDKFHHYAVPKTAQHARHTYLIMKLEREKLRSRFKW